MVTNRVKTRERSPGRVGAVTPLPKYYTDLKSVSALPSWMAHSRSTSATYIDGAGKRRFAGNNLVANGDFTGYAFHGTNAGSSSISATGIPDPYGGNQAIQLTFGGVDTEFYRTVTAPISLRKRASFWVKGTAGETIGWAIDDDGANQLITLTGAWQFIHNTSKGASNANVYTDIWTYDFGLGAATARVIQVYLPVISIVEDWNTGPRSEDQIFTTGALYQAPRFGYDYRNGALVRGGLIVEAEQRTNYCLGTDINDTGSGYWGTNFATLDQPGQTIAGKIAWRLRPNSTPVGEYAGFWTFSTSASSDSGNNPSAWSIDFKYGNHPYVFVTIELGNLANSYATAVFDLSGTSDQDPTETFVSTAGVVIYTKAKYRGNGEWRIFFVSKCPGGDPTYVIPLTGFAPTATGNTVNVNGAPVIPDGSHLIPNTAFGYFLDALLEIGHEKPSQEWIPHNLTRDMDVITVANPVLPLFSGPFTASFGFLISFPYTNDFADMIAWIASPEYLEFGAVRNGFGAGSDYQMQLWANSSQYNSSVILNPPGTTSNKAAFKISGGAAAVGANGNISSVLFGGPGNDAPYRATARVDIGQYSDGNFDSFQGWFEYIAFWDSALSDFDLAVVSS